MEGLGQMFRRSHIFAAACSLCVFASISLPGLSFAGDSWPQFRGPRGDGHSTAKNVPVEWNANKNVAWKVELPGAGLSSPILEAGQLYLTYSTGGDANRDLGLGVCCLDANSGSVLWKKICFTHKTSALPGIHKKNSHASPTPLLDGGRMFIHFGHLGTACLSTSGEITWKNEELKYPPVHGSGASPILFKEKLLFSCDGGSDPFVVALDAKAGKIAWKTPRQQEAKKYFAFATSTVIRVGGKDLLISPGADCVMALDPISGKEIWRVRYDGYSVIPKPNFANGLIYLSTCYDSPKVLAIKPEGKGDLTDSNIVWEAAKGAPNTPSMIAVGGRLFMVSDDGIATCLDAVKGKQVWQKRIGGNFSASPFLAEGRLYLTDEKGLTTVIEASDKYTEIAKNDLADPTLASAAVVDGAIFLRGESHLYKISSAP
jgi:outer membrane protein assembly factor BamB